MLGVKGYGRVTGTLIEAWGVAKTVLDGRKPLVKFFPPLVDVAKPMLEDPPSKKRPTWKAETIVEPEDNVSGSTSVACWLVALVYGSLLIWTRLKAKAEIVDESANTRACVIPKKPYIGHLNREISDFIVPP
jgi:hypothetical protein